MSYTRFCRKHPTYAAKRPPRSACQACEVAYRRECEKKRIVRIAAEKLCDLLGVEVQLTAEYSRPGCDDAGVRVVVSPRRQEAA